MSVDINAAIKICTGDPKRWHKVGVCKEEDADAVVADLAARSLPDGRWSWTHRRSSDGIGLAGVWAMYCEHEDVERQRIWDEHDAAVRARREVGCWPDGAHA